MNFYPLSRIQPYYAPGGGGGGALPGAKSVDSGVVDLTAADVSKAVVFTLAFTSPPAVSAEVILPDGVSPGFNAWPIETTRTTAGVTFAFDAAVPGSGYKLAWTASGS